MWEKARVNPSYERAINCRKRESGRCSQAAGHERHARCITRLFSQRAAGKRLRFNLGRYSPRIWPRPRRRAPGRWCILFLFWCATLLGVLISLDIKFYSLVHLCSLFFSPAHTHAEGGSDRKGAFFYAHWTRPLFTSAWRLLPVISYAEQRIRSRTHTLESVCSASSSSPAAPLARADISHWDQQKAATTWPQFSMTDIASQLAFPRKNRKGRGPQMEK